MRKYSVEFQLLIGPYDDDEAFLLEDARDSMLRILAGIFPSGEFYGGAELAEGSVTVRACNGGEE